MSKAFREKVDERQQIFFRLPPKEDAAAANVGGEEGLIREIK